MAWFLLDVKHESYEKRIEQCREMHEKNAPGCLLSVVLSDDGARALVKVAGVDKGWIPEALEAADSVLEHNEKFTELAAQWSRSIEAK